MQTAEENSKFKMMPGSTTGMSYLLLGRRGNMAIGIKPTVVMKGEAFGSDGNTWFGSKLRVAPGGDMFEDSSGPVVSLADAQKFERPKDALPNITWDNDGRSRASTTIGVLLKGSPDGSEDEMKSFLEQIDNGALAKKMASYIVELVGAEYLTLSEADIAEWFDGHYQKVVETIQTNIEMRKKVATAMEDTMGIVGVQADILKKVYEASNEAKGIAQDEPDDEFDDADGDYDAEDDDYSA